MTTDSTTSCSSNPAAQETFFLRRWRLGTELQIAVRQELVVREAQAELEAEPVHAVEDLEQHGVPALLEVDGKDVLIQLAAAVNVVLPDERAVDPDLDAVVAAAAAVRIGTASLAGT